MTGLTEHELIHERTITGRSWLTWEVVTSVADVSALSQLNYMPNFHFLSHRVFAANFQISIRRKEKGLFVSQFGHIFHLDHKLTTCPDDVIKMHEESEHS